jgi:sensor histidine kinase YesM
MEDAHTELSIPAGRPLFNTLVSTALFNTAIAGLLATVGFGESIATTWVFSQCVGLTMCIFVFTGLRFTRDSARVPRATALVLTIFLGAVTGSGLGSLFMQRVTSGTHWDAGFLLRVVGISILFGLIITYFFRSRQRLTASVQLLNEERIKRLAGEKQLLQADLKRLQAQIEPHFLFNTLANIVSLMDTDATKAKQMQLDLIRYLRTSLSQARKQTTTLGQEIALLRAYLDIYKIRMGARLHYEIDIPDDLDDCPIAPMLLQPLVENALLHGLEPKIEGGRIDISAQRHANGLKIEISDTGDGWRDESRPGVGLTNVRERLENLFTPPGRLRIEENRPRGVRMVVEIPLGEAVSSELALIE